LRGGAARPSGARRKGGRGIDLHNRGARAVDGVGNTAAASAAGAAGTTGATDGSVRAITTEERAGLVRFASGAHAAVSSRAAGASVTTSAAVTAIAGGEVACDDLDVGIDDEQSKGPAATITAGPRFATLSAAAASTSAHAKERLADHRTGKQPTG
jgi:hypothetical protein